MIQHIRNRHLFFADLLLLPPAVYLSFVLRFEQLDLGPHWIDFALFTALALVSVPLLLWQMQLYARYWPFASVEELLTLAGAIGLAAGLIDVCILAYHALGQTSRMPHSVAFIFFFMGVAAVAAPRLALRIWPGRPGRQAAASPSCRVLVMGAGHTGAQIVRDLREHPELGMRVVGLLDDDPAKHHTRIHGVPVLGGHAEIPQAAQAQGADMLIIAIPGAAGRRIRAIVKLCDSVGLRTKILPNLHDLLGARFSVSQIRDVQIEDLLRREPVCTDTTAVGLLLRGRRVLVTGGGGSIGGELCRQILAFEPAELIILGHGENSVFEIYHELLGRLAARAPGRPATVVHPLIADIREAARVEELFAEHRPEVVFHAAAHKHVPLMERNPREAITNNVLGTRNLLRAAGRHAVGHLVMISTDKSVNPTSIMGASKRIAELLVHQAARHSGRPYVAVRFGNVLGSRGSVVLTFKRQIAAGGPVTVTHPEMRRFFMSIPEAVQLVLQAASLGRGGEVFTLDMGEPLRIVDLARDMIALSGLEVGGDIDIVYTGLRPGEKLYEELFVPGEEYGRTAHEKIFIAANASALIPADLDLRIAELERALGQGDSGALLAAIAGLVPNHRLEQAQAPLMAAAVGG